MGKLNIKPGSQDVTVYISVADSASTTGGKKTGLAYDSAGLTAYYTRTRAVSTAITLATLAAADSAHADGGFKEVDATNQPGAYRLDLPDAVVAAGARSVLVTLKGASGMVQTDLEIDLAGEVDAVKVGGVDGTALPELTGAPGATPTLAQALMWLYMKAKNLGTQTATTQTVANDAGTTIASATTSDDGTTTSRGEFS